MFSVKIGLFCIYTCIYPVLYITTEFEAGLRFFCTVTKLKIIILYSNIPAGLSELLEI